MEKENYLNTILIKISKPKAQFKKHQEKHIFLMLTKRKEIIYYSHVKFQTTLNGIRKAHKDVCLTHPN